MQTIDNYIELDLMDRYYFMNSLAKVQLDFITKNQIRTFKIAFITNREWSDPQRFEETVSRNRGAIVLTTPDTKEALNWLGV